MPARQVRQDDAPAAGEWVPALQLVHEVASAAEKLPAWHDKQVDAPAAAEKLPSGHVRQRAAPAGEKKPALQLEHEVLPGADVPAR